MKKTKEPLVSSDTLSTPVVIEGNEVLKELPEPGQILIYDFRPDSSRMVEKEGSKKLKVRQNYLHPNNASAPTLKAIQWNIERAYKLDHIIQALLYHDPDIICLQELDIGCARSGFRNSAYEIAKALQMKCAFVVEFIEYSSPLRSPHTQGGGVHGNAILSRYDLEPRTIEHTYHPVNWNTDGDRFREPRRGERLILSADIFVPSLPTPILAYSLHLEVFCGIYGRLRQFLDVLEDSKTHLSSHPYQLIFGDLNTMAHGIARLSPSYCSDKLRWMSLGYSEARWWQRHIFDNIVDEQNYYIGDETKEELKNDSLHASTLDPRRLVNPYFFDPFCLNKDTTLQGYFGLYRGKLDWTLIRGCKALAKGMDNHNYHWSDHKLLYVILKPVIYRPLPKTASQLPLSKHLSATTSDHTIPTMTNLDAEQAELQSDWIGKEAYRTGHVKHNHSRETLASLVWSLTVSATMVLGTSACIMYYYRTHHL